MPKFIDLTGQKFGRLTVIKMIDERLNNGRIQWKCKCECGKIKNITGIYLRQGESRSCGCLHKDNIKKTHGLSKCKTYKTWSHMIQRCENSKRIKYKDYGGRGIKVCERWHKFENFYEDMGERPDKTTLDRIDNNKGYYKENCRWATSKQQSRNKRNNINYTYNGKTQCLTDWARELNISIPTLFARINLYQWSIEKSLIMPTRKYKS